MSGAPDRNAIRRRLPTIAVLSVALGAALALGYVGRVGVEHVGVRSAGPPPVFDVLLLEVRGGRAVCYCGQESFPPVVVGSRTLPTAPPLGWRTFARPDGLGRLESRQALWGFDAHRLGGTPPGSLYLLSVPLWTVELLCSVAPLSWLWTRRRTPASPSGFDVVSPSSDPT